MVEKEVHSVIVVEDEGAMIVEVYGARTETNRQINKANKTSTISISGIFSRLTYLNEVKAYTYL